MEKHCLDQEPCSYRKLKNSAGPNIQVWGSSELIQLLLKNDLVDELRLKIHPLTLGKGKKLFSSGPIPAPFTLTESIVTSTGVIIAAYTRAGEVTTGESGTKKTVSSPAYKEGNFEVPKHSKGQHQDFVRYVTILFPLLHE